MYEYDTFGNELNKDESDTNTFRFAGEYFDNDTNVYYNRARYYNPSIGRFMSEDRYTGNNNVILSLNRYTYCPNNPVYYVDSSGNSVCEAALKIAVNSIKETTTKLAKEETKCFAYNLLGVSKERPNYYATYTQKLTSTMLKETKLDKGVKFGKKVYACLMKRICFDEVLRMFSITSG